MKLSSVQIEIIRAHIASSIGIKSLQDDVLDHVCCFLENRESFEGEFEEAVHAALYDLAPHGLHELERQTQLLLNIKVIVMKKFIYALGLITAITSSMGICFKLLHLKGADFLLTWGLLAFTLLYVPAQVLVRYRGNEHKTISEKLKILFALLSGLMTAVAIILRLFHISGTEVEMLFLAGAVTFSFGFLPIQFFGLYKKSLA